MIAYHAALELHGCAYTEGHEVQVIASGEPGLFEAAGFTCRFIRWPRGFTSSDGVVSLDRLGLQLAVTTIERTIVDLFDRYGIYRLAKANATAMPSTTPRAASSTRAGVLSTATP